MRSGKGCKSRLVTSGPSLIEHAAESDSQQKRGEHQCECICGASKSGGKQSNPSNLIADCRGPDEGKCYEQQCNEGSFSRLPILPCRRSALGLVAKRGGGDYFEMPGDPQRNCTGTSVQQNCGGDREPQSNCGKEDESRGDGAGYRTKCVHPIEAANTPANLGRALSLVRGKAANQNRQRPSHEKAGDN